MPTTEKRKSAKAKTHARMGPPIQMQGPLGELAIALGGRQKLADAIGVSARTVARWATGELLPQRYPRVKLAELAKKHGITPPYETGPTCPRPAWLDE